MPLSSYRVYVDHPYIDVLIKDPVTNEVDMVTGNFLIDTGAAISLLNKKYKVFLSKMTPVDFIKIQYGGGKEKRLQYIKLQ